MNQPHQLRGSKKANRRRRGQSLIEFLFVGIPLMFILISVFEISRGMWIYHTLAYSVKQGVRYASVHGTNCVYDPPTVTNSCAVTVADVAGVIKSAGIGLDTDKTFLTFIAGNAVTTCYLAKPDGTGCPSLTAAQWPPSSANRVGQIIEIDIVTPFNSMIAMFWPGAAPVSFASVNLPASSTDQIQF